MRFRLLHVLGAMAFAAVFAAAMSVPTYRSYAVIRLVAWLAYAALVVTAICSQGQKRLVVACGLFFGFSYIWLSIDGGKNLGLATSNGLDDLYMRLFKSDYREDGSRQWVFRTIGDYFLSFVFAAIGAAQAAYLLRSRSDPK